MARNRSRVRREDNTFASRRLPDLNSYVTPVPYNRLRLYEDRRYWHPEGLYSPARSFSQSRHRLRHTTQPRPRGARLNKQYNPSRLNFGTLSHRIGFRNPDRVLICVRRQQRREVLHARRKTGRRGQRRPRFNWYSKISCRR